MGRLNGTLSVAVLTGLVAGSPGAVQAQPASRGLQLSRVSTAPASRPTVGAISGDVSDERGGPLSGAIVSVLGTATMAADVTDARGRFSLEKLPMGDYLLRARLPGFAASRHELVRLSSGAAVYRVQLRRLESTVGTTGESPASPAGRPIVPAGFELPRGESTVAAGGAEPAASGDHPHTEAAWRLRHLPRTILKDSANAAVVPDSGPATGGSLFGRAADSAAGFASSLFGDLPISGEVNLLTTGAFGPGNLFSGDALPRGVAYLSIGAPMPAGNWLMRAAMSEGDLSSWIVAGSFVSHPEARHSYDLGFSYSTQEYQGGNPIALAALTDGSRNVGEIFAVDRWTLSPGVTFEYGGRYARHDYLQDRGLLSPRVALALAPSTSTRLSAVLSQRMVAPGAEEFLSPHVPGPWLPPERTFSSLAQDGLQVERARSLDVLFEHEFNRTYVLGVRRFFQSMDNQLVTLFGLNMPGGPRSVGHYYVTNAGPVDAQGWGVRLSTPPTQPVRASIEYSVTNARWSGQSDRAGRDPWAQAAARRDGEDIHDITTSFETDIPETATRVFVLYKMNTAFARSSANLQQPGLDGRFDVQVNQALPFGVAGTKWEVLLGLRNLFRDPTDPASVYDELLVLRPPKRVVGGVLVRF